MDADRRKILDAAEGEIARFTGGETEYVEWLGKAAAAVTSTMIACQKLMDLAEKQGRPFEDKVRIQVAFLAWYGQFVTMVGSLLETVGEMILSSTAGVIPCSVLEPVTGMYIAAHRMAFALWRDREETRLLWKDVPASIN
jgi:hypothetical protein